MYIRHLSLASTKRQRRRREPREGPVSHTRPSTLAGTRVFGRGKERKALWALSQPDGRILQEGDRSGIRRPAQGNLLTRGRPLGTQSLVSGCVNKTHRFCSTRMCLSGIWIFGFVGYVQEMDGQPAGTPSGFDFWFPLIACSVQERAWADTPVLEPGL